MTIALVVLGLFILVMINVPIAVGLGIVAVVGMMISRGFDSVFNAALTMFDGATNFPLLAIPLFILAGALMNTTSISRRLITLTSALIGFVRGGLAMVNVGVSMFFAEISGSAVADVAAIGSVLIPAMVRRKYTAKLAAAVTSSSASIAIIIPPSIAMIIYGALADASIVQLFVAGVVPGVLGGLAMMALCYWYAVRYDLPREEAFDLGRLWKAFKEAGWALLLPGFFRRFLDDERARIKQAVGKL
jgi:tripartite ATP-independent transporter DctM subunit